MYIYIYLYICIYILILCAFCIECQIFCNNSTRHFFKTVIFRILRIFNGPCMYTVLNLAMLIYFCTYIISIKYYSYCHYYHYFNQWFDQCRLFMFTAFKTVLKSDRSKMNIIIMKTIYTLCVVDHSWPIIIRSFHTLLTTLWFIGTIMCLSTWVVTKLLQW